MQKKLWIVLCFVFGHTFGMLKDKSQKAIQFHNDLSQTGLPKSHVEKILNQTDVTVILEDMKAPVNDFFSSTLANFLVKKLNSTSEWNSITTKLADIIVSEQDTTARTSLIKKFIAELQKDINSSTSKGFSFIALLDPKYQEIIDVWKKEYPQVLNVAKGPDGQLGKSYTMYTQQQEELKKQMEMLEKKRAEALQQAQAVVNQLADSLYDVTLSV